VIPAQRPGPSALLPLLVLTAVAAALALRRPSLKRS
jgi:hypothetical protein